MQDNYSTALKKYEALCRGEGRTKQSQNQNLKCTYSTRNNNPYFALRRVKEEQVHLEPPVWIFHDVIYDSEIEIIKKIAIPLVKFGYNLLKHFFIRNCSD
jgi:prolyl 4-hydroxylase